MIKTMVAADALVTQVAKASADMVWIFVAWNMKISAP